MHTYPANEQRISAVERGLTCKAVVALAPGESPTIGQTVLFALSQARPGQPPAYVKGGDSVLVALTGVTDLGETDTHTGQALVRLAWEPLGQPLPEAVGRRSRSRATRKV